MDSQAMARTAAPSRYIHDQAPILVYWETTRACDLACIHCRAGAMQTPDPDQLTTAAGKDLLRAVRSFTPRVPQVVITGGDPMRRPDLFDLIAYARSIGVPVALAPSVTPLLTRTALFDLCALGIRIISLSLDGDCADLHDGVRGITGTFDRTLEAIRDATAAGLQVQINTLVTANSYAALPRIYELLKTLKIMRWSLFFLITLGRGSVLPQITPAESEALCRYIADLIPLAPFEVKATEAPHFRRVAMQRMREGGMEMADIMKTHVGRGLGIRDGNGVMFISHRGDVYPSGFLPIVAGNVREQSPVLIYRTAPVFTSLREVDSFTGKCGLCEYRTFCGGSRARAYAATGDPLASDPLCLYDPGSHRPALGSM